MLISVAIHSHLAKTIKQTDQTEEQDKRQRILWSAPDWTINKDNHKININPKNADDISFIRSDEGKTHEVERFIPPMLNTNNLEINKSKIEKKRNDELWKKCKCVGSRIDTKTDIIQRKILMTTNYNILENLF